MLWILRKNKIKKSSKKAELRKEAPVGINGAFWDDLDQNFQIFNH